MCKLIKRVLCFVIIGVIAFLVIALWSGGDKFRWFGEKTGGMIKKSSEQFGNKADTIKEKKDATTAKIKKWTGKGDDEAEEPAENTIKKSGKKGPDKHSGKNSPQRQELKSESKDGEGSEEKSLWQSARELWSKVMNKIKGPEKDQ